MSIIPSAEVESEFALEDAIIWSSDPHDEKRFDQAQAWLDDEEIADMLFAESMVWNSDDPSWEF